MSWPPTLDQLKVDIRVTDDRDDARLQLVLDAAVAFVERVHAGRWGFPGSAVREVGPVPEDITLGTLRLAGRWHARRRSPDGIVQAGDLGTTRISTQDADLDRLLRIGRYRRSVIA